MLPAIRSSEDFRRIKNMARREWSAEQTEELQELFTQALKTPHGTWRLKPIQAQALADLSEVDGLFLAAGVGFGKTLVGFLAAVVCKAARPVLLVQANLKDKTQKDLSILRQHWELPTNIKVITYEALGRVSGAKTLEDISPDLIIADECQCLKNPRAARSRRFLRYMRQHLSTKFVAMSGTVSRRSLKDYWHLISLALPERSPLPYKWPELERWADALDADVEDFKRPRPGVLLEFCLPEDKKLEPLESARTAFRRRLTSTWGVVATSESSIGTALVVQQRAVQMPPAVADAISGLRDTWETPNGDEIQYAPEIWRYSRELACGFFYRWDPAPPKPWLYARKAWRQFVRETLKHSRLLDSPLQVANANPNHPLLHAWTAVRGQYKINSVPVWIDDYVVNDAVEWMEQNEGIVWVEHRAVGERIAELSGRRYYGGGMAASKDILDAKGPFVASIKAHGTGKNLQHMSTNLVVSAPPSGSVWEQMLGRTHRLGQEADQVLVEFYLQCDEIREGFEKALADAEYLQYTLGQQQKLLYADKVFI